MEQKIVDLFDDTEEEEPEPELTPSKISGAVVWNTDWTVETVLTQLARNNIDMPEFQRRDAWSRRRKSRYIESLILGFPVPQIVLAERKEKRGSYLVLDGKQRLLSILQFTGSDEGSINNNFRLQGLEVLKDDFNRKKLNDINHDSLRKSTFEPFYNQTIRAVVIRNWPSRSFLHMLFIRLNSETLPLSPQELRQAMFPGEFIKFADEASRKSQAIKVLLGLNPDEPDLRMRDVELLVRYLAFSFYLSEHRGSLKGFLDNTCDKLNQSWAEKEEVIKAQVKTFEQAVNAASKIFGPRNIGRRWSEEAGGFSPRLNKAILDVIIFYFSDEEIRKKSISEAVNVKDSFKKLCLDSDDFITSIEMTTKSIKAIITRLQLWGEYLRQATGLSFNIPELKKDGQINFAGFW